MGYGQAAHGTNLSPLFKLLVKLINECASNMKALVFTVVCFESNILQSNHHGCNAGPRKSINHNFYSSDAAPKWRGFPDISLGFHYPIPHIPTLPTRKILRKA